MKHCSFILYVWAHLVEDKLLHRTLFGSIAHSVSGSNPDWMIATEMKVIMGEINKPGEELACTQLFLPAWHKSDNDKIALMCFDRKRSWEQKCLCACVSSHEDVVLEPFMLWLLIYDLFTPSCQKKCNIHYGGCFVQGWVCFSLHNTQQSENVGMKSKWQGPFLTIDTLEMCWFSLVSNKSSADFPLHL